MLKDLLPVVLTPLWDMVGTFKASSEVNEFKSR